MKLILLIACIVRETTKAKIIRISLLLFYVFIIKIYLILIKNITEKARNQKLVITYLLGARIQDVYLIK